MLTREPLDVFCVLSSCLTLSNFSASPPEAARSETGEQDWRGRRVWGPLKGGARRPRRRLCVCGNHYNLDVGSCRRLGEGKRSACVYGGSDLVADMFVFYYWRGDDSKHPNSPSLCEHLHLTNVYFIISLFCVLTLGFIGLLKRWFVVFYSWRWNFLKIFAFHTATSAPLVLELSTTSHGPRGFWHIRTFKLQII